ncbi:unnamed protein product [Bursaphelenchus okinawaensis]|uniref:Uncharacterized protein n=1 Tax=Bursaphelenchus okinawaensis TaxID=465554 RepID=A0A811KS80_9BILA|nr:unnamed protein product [Bursaphelenchus okinawaensis]CAG9109564.1 unnamed protein product [Bursaphelenchus okinawaensis]
MKLRRLCCAHKSTMISTLCLLVVIVCTDAAAPKDTRQPYINKDGAQVVPMGKEDTEQLYQKWTEQGMSSVIAALAHTKLKKHRAHVRKMFGECTKNAKDISSQAKCVEKLDNGDFTPILVFAGKRKKLTRLEKLKELPNPETPRLNRLRHSSPWVGNFKTLRVKRALEVHRSENYHLYRSKDEMSPFGKVAKTLLQSVLEVKKKDIHDRWEQVIEQAQNINKETSRLFEKRDDSDENLDDPLKFKSMAKQYENNGVMEQTKKLAKLQKIDEDDPSSPDVLNDIVSEYGKQNKPKSPEEKITNLLKDGIKLGYSLAGHDTSDFDEKSMRIASPRFLSLMPELNSKNQLDLASPSLLSLHSQGSGLENLTSIPSLLTGIKDQDRQAWLDLIVEASGVSDHLKDLSNNLDKMNGAFEDGFDNYRNLGKRSTDGMPLYFTKENVTKVYGKKGEDNVEHWETLNRMISKEQLKDMNSTGFAILTPQQQAFMYGKKSPYADSGALKRFQNLTKEDVYSELDKDVKALADSGSRLDTRLKDVVLSPITFTYIVNTFNYGSSTILSPLAFSPSILSPTVFGPMIVSPWIFSPQILSPKLFSPLILAPYIFSPLILSPLNFHVQILSPGIFNPHVLTPFLLSPLILTPQVFSPLILCPQVLTPLILNPSVGSPKVLSPFVLSPSIFSPQALSALVLSPYAISPLFYSRVVFFRLILSPSILS